MKQKILIIRSVSYQQLDKNFPVIREQLEKSHSDGFEYFILTHTHGIERAAQYETVSAERVIDYGSRGNFSPFILPEKIKQETFNGVVVPVTNMSGGGFLNVFLLALRISGMNGKIFCCNLVSDIREMTGIGILIQLAKSCLFSVAALIGTVLFVLLFPIFWMAGIFMGKK